MPLVLLGCVHYSQLNYILCRDGDAAATAAASDGAATLHEFVMYKWFVHISCNLFMRAVVLENI